MTRRLALFVVVLGILLGAGLALLPVAQPAPPSRGAGIYGGTDATRCGSAALAFFRDDGTCHDLGRDRLTIAGVVGGGVALAGLAGVVLTRNDEDAPARPHRGGDREGAGADL